MIITRMVGESYAAYRRRDLWHNTTKPALSKALLFALAVLVAYAVLYGGILVGRAALTTDMVPACKPAPAAQETP